MKLARLYLVTLAAAIVTCSAVLAGPYSLATADPTNPYDAGVPGFVGPDGDGVVSANNYVNPALVGWASAVTDYSPAPGLDAKWTSSAKTLGPVTGDYLDVASLGDLTQSQIDGGTAPGRVTLSFDVPIHNGAGADLAVFENAYMVGDYTFAELGYVEVSTDGVNFARFPSVSLTESLVGAYGNIDATDVYNLAGKHVNHEGTSFGTPFDLQTLADDPMVVGEQVDLSEINYVRIVDIPGSGDFLDAASPANPIYDAWWTWGSGGVDLEAIGALHQGIAGDTDWDGDVDNVDFGALYGSFTGPEGAGMTWQQGNFDYDGDVDNVDFGTLYGCYTGPLAGGAFDGAIVPEPVTVGVLVLAAAGALIRRRTTG